MKSILFISCLVVIAASAPSDVVSARLKIARPLDPLGGEDSLELICSATTQRCRVGRRADGTVVARGELSWSEARGILRPLAAVSKTRAADRGDRAIVYWEGELEQRSLSNGLYPADFADPISGATEKRIDALLKAESALYGFLKPAW